MGIDKEHSYFQGWVDIENENERLEKERFLLSDLKQDVAGQSQI